MNGEQPPLPHEEQKGVPMQTYRQQTPDTPQRNVTQQDRTIPARAEDGATQQSENVAYLFNAGYDQHGAFGETNSTTHSTIVLTSPPDVAPGVHIIRPSNVVIPAVLTCICCFFPVGIVAIVYAIKAKNLADAGDYVQAESKARKARILVYVAVGIQMALAIGVGIMACVMLYLNSRPDPE